MTHTQTYIVEVLVLLIICFVNNCQFPACSSALGMENGRIPDSRITASSVHANRSDLQPWTGRLNKSSGAWTPQLNQSENWLKVDLAQKMIVTKIATQGRPVHTAWVTSYNISFSQDDHAWEVYKEHGVEKVKGIFYAEVTAKITGIRVPFS